MKKLTAIMTALLLIGMAFVAGSAMAQSSTEASVEGSATVYVVTPVTFSDPAGDPTPGALALDFGKGKPGTSVSLAATAGATATGALDATGSHNDGVVLNGETDRPINVSTGASSCDVGVALGTTLSAGSGMSGDTIWVGGTMDIDAGTVQGNYGCSFTLTADY